MTQPNNQNFIDKATEILESPNKDNILYLAFQLAEMYQRGIDDGIFRSDNEPR